MRLLCLMLGVAGCAAASPSAHAQSADAPVASSEAHVSPAAEVAESRQLQARFVSMYESLVTKQREAPHGTEALEKALRAYRGPEPQPEPWSGTLYAIRIYTYTPPDAIVPLNPAVRWNGVIGAAMHPVLGYEPPPEKPAASAPAPTPPAPPAAKPNAPAAQPTQPTAPAQPTQPSLDDLLGITPKVKPDASGTTAPKDGTATTTPTGAAPDQSKADLDRLLTAQEIGDALKQAIALMGDASTRLNDHKDPGLGTQRVQEDVVKRLDQLLASLDKQQQQSQQQSSSSQKPEPKQEPGQKKPQQGQQQSQQQPKQGDGMQMHDGPTLQQGQLNPQLESARAAWGSLPARVRAMLMQGTEDRFSSRYKAMTQEYYKRLAEENSK